MAISVNRVTLVGYLGADPEEPSNDKAPLTLSVATSERWKDKSSGEKREKTEWHRVKVWADHSKKFLLDYAAKGDLIYVEGQLETSSYEKEGVTHYSTAVVVKQFDGKVQLTSKDGGKREPGEDREEKPKNDSFKRDEGAPSRRPGASRGGAETNWNNMDDDIPF